MFRKWFYENNDFTLGALFGIILSPVAVYVWRWLQMILGWSAFWQNLVLFVLAMSILLTYLFSKRKRDREEEDAEVRTRIIQNAIASKLGIDLDAEITKAKRFGKSARKQDHDEDVVPND